MSIKTRVEEEPIYNVVVSDVDVNAECNSSIHSQADPPSYTIETDPSPKLTTLDALKLRYPKGPWCDDKKSDQGGPCSTNEGLPFYDSIREKDDFTLTYLLENEYFTAKFPDHRGFTPLLVAIEAGNQGAVDLLMRFGASVNDYGTVERNDDRVWGKESHIYRTPLQFAAEKGNLVLVKLLLETYHADDAQVAPDGQLALRLAAANGHREIVDYLPARRGGGWRRWEVKHRAVMFRIERYVRDIGLLIKFIFYDCPGYLGRCVSYVIVKPLWKRLVWAWTHRSEVPAALAKLTGRIGRGVWSSIKHLPDGLKKLWGVMKKVPGAMKVAGRWIWRGVVAFGEACYSIIARLLSFLHTLIITIGTWFRNLTLRNIWQAFCSFIRAVLIEGPARLWKWLKSLSDVTYVMLTKVFGFVGAVVWIIAVAFLSMIMYIPVKSWKIITSFGTLVGKAFTEVLVWYNPKR